MEESSIYNKQNDRKKETKNDIYLQNETAARIDWWYQRERVVGSKTTPPPPKSKPW
jgi:hypothetical protein